MKCINDFIEKNIKKILFIYIIIQPIIDVFTGICVNYFHFNITLSSIIRLLFMGFCFYFLFFINKNRKIYGIIFLIVLYFLFFCGGTLLYKGFDAFSFEIKNLLNTFYFPVVLISLCEMYKKYKLAFDIKNIFLVYFIYCILVFVPNIFNIGFESYSVAKVGSVGWFLSANAVGNILCLLLPIIIYYFLKKNINISIKFICFLLVLYVFFSMGTKVPIIGLLVCLVINFIYYFIGFIKSREYKKITLIFLVILILSTSALLIVPKTSFYKNIQIHKEYLGFNSYIDIFKDYELIDHFIFSQRLTFLNNTRNSYLNSNLYEKTFGIGYIENYGTDNLSIKTIEIDYFDVLYRHGVIGFFIYFIIVIPYFVKAFKRLRFNLLNLEYGISLVLIIFLAFFSGHVFVVPAVSIYVCLIISNILGGLYEKIN